MKPFSYSYHTILQSSCCVYSHLSLSLTHVGVQSKLLYIYIYMKNAVTAVFHSTHDLHNTY